MKATNTKKNPTNQQSTTLGNKKIHAKNNMGNNYAVVNIMINKFITTG